MADLCCYFAFTHAQILPYYQHHLVLSTPFSFICYYL